MRTREKSLVDHGVWPEDIEKLYEYCKHLSREESLLLILCIRAGSTGIRQSHDRNRVQDSDQARAGDISKSG